MRLVIILPIFLTLIGCQTVTQQEIASMDYGPCPVEYQELAKQACDKILIDPYSAHYEFPFTPIKGRLRSIFEMDYGWFVLFHCNSKNRIGGYTGNKAYAVVIRYDKVIKVFTESGDVGLILSLYEKRGY